ncbi:hypothetical protein EEB11_06230 [Pseudotabrizicola sediminis]|uniref:Uncharacterized protein n=1 Tax=Pseudotabrizicola sediminis TaxID=2486418 RepID=A0ABY2KNQ1_9RHOB|nr:hypothetical protein EEB11_06230 [Pseudotabrizicola sediminis]
MRCGVRSGPAAAAQAAPAQPQPAAPAPPWCRCAPAPAARPILRVAPTGGAGSCHNSLPRGPGRSAPAAWGSVPFRQERPAPAPVPARCAATAARPGAAFQTDLCPGRPDVPPSTRRPGPPFAGL